MTLCSRFPRGATGPIQPDLPLRPETRIGVAKLTQFKSGFRRAFGRDWVSFANPPACYRSLSGPSCPKCPRSVPRVSVGVSLGPFGPRAPECPKRCSGHSGETLGTRFGHSGAQGPQGPRDTPKDTPGTLQARRARETPVASWGVLKVSFSTGVLKVSFSTAEKLGCKQGGHSPGGFPPIFYFDALMFMAVYPSG